MKELIFDRVTNALFIFVVKHWNAVQIRLMAVIKKVDFELRETNVYRHQNT